MATTCHCVHGPGHNCTSSADEQLEKCTKRYVFDKRYEFLYFEALRYVNEGEICIVTCPIEDPRIIDNESRHYVPSNLVLPMNGCPVMCCSLVHESHLNSEVGDVTTQHKTRNGGLKCTSKRRL